MADMKQLGNLKQLNYQAMNAEEGQAGTGSGSDDCQAVAQCEETPVLLHNAKRLLQAEANVKRFPVEECYGWLDSTVALHWINGSGKYEQFVRNQVKQLKKSYIKWRYFGTKKNPADIERRGCSSNRLPKEWLSGQRGSLRWVTGHMTLSNRQLMSLTLK